jgi:hypothetical protein
MTLTWTERPIELWGRTRDGFESYVYNGVYHVGMIEPVKEKPALRLLLDSQGGACFPICYRASFIPIVDAEDSVMLRVQTLSGFYPTAEEAKQWCQDLEDRYNRKKKKPRPPMVSSDSGDIS